MTTMDVMPFGDGQFLVQLFRLPAIPDEVEFGRYYEATCDIALKDDNTIRLECVVHRPTNRRNVAGVRQIDWLWLLLKTNLTSKQLSDASIKVAQYGLELEEQEVAVRAGRGIKQYTTRS